MTDLRIGTMIGTSAGELHVREDGRDGAPPVVLLHGVSTSLRWFDRVTSLLSGQLRVIRIDLLGHGYSAKPGSGYDPVAQASAIAEVLEALEVTDATVVGHSYSGDVAVALAERTPRASRVVVINDSPDHNVPPFAAAANAVMVHPRIGKLLYNIAPDVALKQATKLAFAPGFDAAAAFENPRQPLDDFKATPHACYRACMLEKARYVQEKTLDARLADLGIPALVIFGARDRVFRVEAACQRFDAVGSIRVEIIDEAGHSPMVEAPAEVATLLLDFVRTSTT